MDKNDKDYLNLLGETMALQVVLVALSRQMAAADRVAVAAAYDGAANLIEVLALRIGQHRSAYHIGHALRVVEEMRTASLSRDISEG
jgi:hypothetical protein